MLSNSPNPSIFCFHDSGNGRSFGLVYEANSVYEAYAKALAACLEHNRRVLILQSNPVGETNWLELSRSLRQTIDDKQVRQISLVGFGAAAALVQNLCLEAPKLVRTLILVDAATRPHPGWRSRFLDRLEGLLPLGLPFRLRSPAFDAKPYLQRLRCPTLVVSSPLSGAHELAERNFLVNRTATAWRQELNTHDPMQHLAGLVEVFQEVPARCPQKNR